MGRKVLVVGESDPADLEVVQALARLGLDVRVVARERLALRVLAQGEKPHAVLILGAWEHPPDCSDGCAGASASKDCIVDCIRRHAGLERVPVMFYSLERGRDPPPEEIAALMAAAAALTP